MTLGETMRDIVNDVIRNLMQMSIERLYSNGKETITIAHIGGAIIELKNDGFVYINGEQVGSVGDPLEVNTIQSELSNALTLKSGTGVFVFERRT